MRIWSTGSDDEGVIRSTKAPKVGSDLLPLPLLLALAIFVIVVLLALLPAPPPHVLFRAAQARQSRPYSGVGLSHSQAKTVKTLFPFGSAAVVCGFDMILIGSWV